MFTGCLSEPIIMLNQCLCLVKLNGTIIVIIILQLQGQMFLSFLKRIFQKIGNFFLSLDDVDKSKEFNIQGNKSQIVNLQQIRLTTNPFSSPISHLLLRQGRKCLSFD